MRALNGKTIVFTRDDSNDVNHPYQTLIDEGANIVSLPLVRIEPIQGDERRFEVFSRLETFDWLLFTSANAVSEFFKRMDQQGASLQRYRGKFAAIGKKTAQALTRHRVCVDLVPKTFRAEGLLDALRREGVRGKRILFPRAEIAREILPQGLREAGAMVEVLPLYRTSNPSAEQLNQIVLALDHSDMLVFTSSSAVKHLCEATHSEIVRLIEKKNIAVIGPVTRKTCEQYGLQVMVMPQKATLDDLSKAIIDYFSQQGEAL